MNFFLKSLFLGLPCCSSTVSIELEGRQAEVWVTRRINTVSGFPPCFYTTMDATFCHVLCTVCMCMFSYYSIRFLLQFAYVQNNVLSCVWAFMLGVWNHVWRVTNTCPWVYFVLHIDIFHPKIVSFQSNHNHFVIVDAFLTLVKFEKW